MVALHYFINRYREGREQRVPVPISDTGMSGFLLLPSDLQHSYSSYNNSAYDFGGGFVGIFFILQRHPRCEMWLICVNMHFIFVGMDFFNGKYVSTFTL